MPEDLAITAASIVFARGLVLVPLVMGGRGPELGDAAVAPVGSSRAVVRALLAYSGGPALGLEEG